VDIWKFAKTALFEKDQAMTFIISFVREKSFEGYLYLNLYSLF